MNHSPCMTESHNRWGLCQVAEDVELEAAQWLGVGERIVRMATPALISLNWDLLANTHLVL